MGQPVPWRTGVRRYRTPAVPATEYRNGQSGTLAGLPVLSCRRGKNPKFYLCFAERIPSTKQSIIVPNKCCCSRVSSEVFLLKSYSVFSA